MNNQSDILHIFLKRIQKFKLLKILAKIIKKMNIYNPICSFEVDNCTYFWGKVTRI